MGDGRWADGRWHARWPIPEDYTADFDVSQHPIEIGDGERLGQDRDRRRTRSSSPSTSADVAGDEDEAAADPRLRRARDGAGTRRRCRPRGARRRAPGRTSARRSRAFASRARRGLGDLVVAPREQPREQRADRLFVLDDERARRARLPRRRGAAGGGRARSGPSPTVCAGSVSWKQAPPAPTGTARACRRARSRCRGAIDRPRPVPSPTSLVVKNGSNTRPRSSGADPGPVVDAPASVWACSPALVRMVMAPGASPIACSALSTRFSTICWISSRLTSTGRTPGWSSSCSAMLRCASWCSRRPRRRAGDLIQVGARRDPASSGARRRAGCGRSARRATPPAGRSRRSRVLAVGAPLLDASARRSR